MHFTRLFSIFIIFIVHTSMAFAHPSHEHGSSNAFLHPFTGPDHFLMALAVGLLIFRTTKLKGFLPVAFLSGMILGFTVTEVAHKELGIMISLGLTGILLVYRNQLSLKVILPLIALSGFYHGNAHGTEISSGNPVLIIMALVAGTSFIHFLGYFIIRFSSQYQNTPLKKVV